MTELGEAVSALVDIRPVITRQEAGEAHEGGVHVETHPSLLSLLLEDTGISKNGGSSDPGIPVDQFRLELWWQMVEIIRDWARAAHAPFSRDFLAESLVSVARAYDALYDAHSIEYESYAEKVRQVDIWVTRIEANFDPDKVIDGTKPCPRCGVRKITSEDRDEPELFAIQLNVTKDTAFCRNSECGTVWAHIAEWRFETNLVEQAASGIDFDPAALELLVTRTTPTK